MIMILSVPKKIMVRGIQRTIPNDAPALNYQGSRENGEPFLPETTWYHSKQSEMSLKWPSVSLPALIVVMVWFFCFCFSMKMCVANW